MKKFLTLFGTLFFGMTLIFISCNSASEQPSINVDIEKITTYEAISASGAVEASKLGWNLGNTFDSYGNVVNPAQSYIKSGNTSNYETAWGNPVTTQKLIKYIKSLGFQSIRMPVTWAENLDKNNNINKKWMARVKQVVEWALDEDLYVIINIHHDTGTKGWLKATAESYNKYNERYEKIWQQIASEFNGYNEKLMFESFNEMVDGAINDTAGTGNWGGTTEENFGYVNKWNQLFVNTVRATGGNNATRNLICNTYAASSGQNILDGFELPTDSAKNHLILEVHNYNVVDESLDEDFLRTAYFAKKIGCPVIIGEWGASTDDSGSESFSYLAPEKRAEHAKNYISLATKRGIACYVWDDGGSYKLVNRKDCSLAHKDIVDAIINNVKETVPLTNAELQEAEENSLPVAEVTDKGTYSISKDLKFTWESKPVVSGNKTGRLSYAVFSTDWTTTYIWYEESFSRTSDSIDLLEKIIANKNVNISSINDLPNEVCVLIKYRYIGEDIEIISKKVSLRS